MRPHGVIPRGTCNVQMRPLRFIDELLNKDGAHDGARLSPRTNVLDVGDVRLDLFAVFLAYWKLPEIFACFLADRDYPIDKGLVITHNPGVLIAERDNYRSRQRRHIDDLRRPLLLGICDRVRKDQTALGVRVEDLYRLAVHCGNYVAWTCRFSVGHVFNGGHDTEYGNSRL